MEQLQVRLQELSDRGEKAMGLFLTAGFPGPEATLPILHTLEEGGADFIELGMPFSDPLAEGRPIQYASEVALRNGVRLTDVLRMAEAFRRESSTPLLLMGYANPVYRYGPARFCQDARAAGVDALILADLPPEEAGELHEAATTAGLGMVYLVAPNTPDTRVETIDRLATAFVYAVSVTGLTGTDIDVERVENYLKRIRGLVTRHPLMVGFGIKQARDAARLSRYTDGYIVGSALIREVEKLWKNPELTEPERLRGVRAFVQRLKLRGATHEHIR